MANLKNINLMSQDTFENIEQVDDELYAVQFGFMPDYEAGVLIDRTTFLAGYKAPSDGVIMGYFNPISGESVVYVNATEVGAGNTTTTPLNIPIYKGDVFKISGTDSTLNNVVFYPFKRS